MRRLDRIDENAGRHAIIEKTCQPKFWMTEDETHWLFLWLVRAMCGKNVVRWSYETRDTWSLSLDSRIVRTSSPVLSRKVNFWMNNPHVPCKSIVAWKCLFLYTQCATNLLLPRVVNGVFVASQIVRTREDGIARLSSSRIDPTNHKLHMDALSPFWRVTSILV